MRMFVIHNKRSEGWARRHALPPGSATLFPQQVGAPLWGSQPPITVPLPWDEGCTAAAPTPRGAGGPLPGAVRQGDDAECSGPAWWQWPGAEVWVRGPGGPALGSPVRTEVPQGPPGSELRSRSWSCDGDLARLAQPWGRQPGRSGSGGRSAEAGWWEAEEWGESRKAGGETWLLIEHLLYTLAPDSWRPIQARKTPRRRSPSVHLVPEDTAPGAEAPRSQAAPWAGGRPGSVRLSHCVSRAPPRAHGLLAQSFPGSFLMD